MRFRVGFFLKYYFCVGAGFGQLGDPQTPANHPPATRAPLGNPPARAEAGGPVPGHPGSPPAPYLDLSRPAGSRRIGGGRLEGEKSRKSSKFQFSRSPRSLVGLLRFWTHCKATGMCFTKKNNYFHSEVGGRWLAQSRNDEKSSKIIKNHRKS